MNFPGSTQLGHGKKLLEQYPWSRFAPHPEWVETNVYAAGIPGELRFIYQPRRKVYDWSGVLVKGLERDVPYHAFYFDPVTAKRYDLGTFIYAGPPPKPFEGHAQPLLFTDTFDGVEASAWKDYGTPTQRQDGRLVGGKGMVTILEKPSERDLMASVDARSDAEAGIILRFHDADHYLVALYTPQLKAIYLHDRQHGAWGEPLGQVDVPAIGPNIRLTAAACGDYAALVLTDGTQTFHTPTVKVRNVSSGKTGMWLFQIGERQEYDNFAQSRTPFTPDQLDAAGDVRRVRSADFRAPNVPSPQDWVLVMERVEAKSAGTHSPAARLLGSGASTKTRSSWAGEHDLVGHHLPQVSLSARLRLGPTRPVARSFALGLTHGYRPSTPR